MKKPLKWIISQSKFIFPFLVLLMATSAAVSLCSVWFAVTSKDIINCATSANHNGLVASGICLCVLILLEIALSIANSRMNVLFGGKLEMRLRENVFSVVLNKKWSDVNSYHSGEIVNRIKNDCSVVAGGVMHILPQGAMFLTRVVAALGVLFTIDFQFALTICAVSPVLLLCGRFYSKKMKFFHKEVQQSEGKAVGYMLENVQNLSVVKAFGTESDASAELASIQKQTLFLRLRRNKWRISANVSLMLLFTGGYALAVLWGAFRLFNKTILFGDFTAMLQLVNQVQTPAKSMGSLLVTYQNTIASAERILELYHLDDDAPSSLPPFDYTSVVFDSVSFSYNSEPVLSEASMRIDKGEFVALAGISGAGKSTVIRLLLSLVDPSEGAIYFDGEHPVPVTASTRRLFGYVPQGNLLVSGTIADNISFHSSISRSDIEKFARIAQLDFVFDLPLGLDTPLGEKGSGLSEGQIQRIAIARALARRPAVLLLDEATASLDEATEIRLLEALKKETSSTVLIITHRKKVFDYCDRIVTLTDAKLVSY